MPEASVVPVQTLPTRLGAEALGTAVLVFAVAGAAIFDAAFRGGDGNLNGGFVAVALALGISVLAGAVAFGGVSGAHFNPAVTVGLATAGRFPWRDVGPYALAQIVGGVLGATVVFLVAAGGPEGFLASAAASGFASTGWGALSPGGFGIGAVFVVEVVATGILVAVVLGATGRSGDSPRAGIAIGLTLTLVAIVAIPVSNGSFNPARSIATALYGGAEAQQQLWLSIVAPVLGGLIAGAAAAAMRTRPHRSHRSTERAATVGRRA